MSLTAWDGFGLLEGDPETGMHNSQIRPINEGYAVTATNTQSGDGGLFGWLDTIGGKLGEIGDSAIDLLGAKWLNDLDDGKNPTVVVQPYQLPTSTGGGGPVAPSAFKEYQPWIIGGVVLLTVMGAVYLGRKR